MESACGAQFRSNVRGKRILLQEAGKLAEPGAGPGLETGPAKKHRLLWWLGITGLLVAMALATAFEILLRRAAPILRARVIQTLSARFNSRVELGDFQVSLVRGFEVSGKHLAIYPSNLATNQPTLSAEKFSFRTTYSNLLRIPMEIGHIDVEGLRIHLPPKSRRGSLPGISGGGEDHSQIKIFVDEIRAKDTVLTLETDKPGKAPLQFVIQNLTLSSVGPGMPLHFVAKLINPKPVGEIESSGSFGPWDAEDPGETPVEGSYSFRNANLATLKGIAGILSSNGKYSGSLRRIVVDGHTDTPDFQIKVSGHKVPLHTDFHAIVDGTSGNIYLQPVIAHFLHSSFTANGYVVRSPTIPGHQISLDVVIDQARIEDLLRLGVRTDPPIMNGNVRLHTRLEIPPGPQDVARKLQLQGNFEILDVHFTNPKFQSRVDQLSLRSQGEGNQPGTGSQGADAVNIGSHMQGDFRLANGELTLTNLIYNVPGAAIHLAGIYSLDGDRFDFFGTANLKATVSELVGGWKGALLKSIDRYFQKDGAGTQVPFRITGTRSEPTFGFDFSHGDAEEQRMLRNKQQ